MADSEWRPAKKLGRLILVRYLPHHWWVGTGCIFCCKAAAVGVLISGIEEFIELGLLGLKLYIYFSYVLLLASAAAIFYASARRPWFKLRYSGICTLIRPFIATLEVWACNRIVSSIKRNSPLLCWLFVGASAYLAFATNIIFPTYDSLIPPLLAQVAMNKAISLSSVNFTAAIFAVCIVIFFVRHVLELERWGDASSDRLNPRYEDSLGEEWRAFWGCFAVRNPNPVVGWVQYFWLVACVASGLGLLVSVCRMGVCHYYLGVPYLALVLLFVLTLALYFYIRLVPQIQCRYPIMSVFLQSICEGIEVLVVAIILNRIKHHSVSLCWLYTAGSAFAVVVIKTILPTYNFLIPISLAEVAMNEVLTEQLKGKGLVFKFGLYAVCYVIYAVLEGIERRLFFLGWRDRMELRQEDMVRRDTILLRRLGLNI